MNDVQATAPRWSDRLERYDAQRKRAADQRQRLARRWRVGAFVRGALFLLTGALAFAAWQDILEIRGGWWAAAALSAIAFLGVVYLHDAIERDLHQVQLDLRRWRQGAARLRRQWDELPLPPLGPRPSAAAESADLDAFGRASLSQLLGSVQTAAGWRTLRDWICLPADEREIAARQPAIAELAADSAWREAFQLRAARLADSPVDAASFVAWSESPPWLAARPHWRVLAALQAGATAAAAAAFFGGWIDPQLSGVAVLVLLALNFFVSVATSGRVHEIFGRVASRQNEIDQYRDLVAEIAQRAAHAAWFESRRQALVGEPGSALGSLHALSRLVWLGSLRRHGILFLAYVALQFLFLWDLHSLAALERWQRKHRGRVRQWLEAIAEVEAAGALATLAWEHPEWVFPQVAAAVGPQLEAERLGHPLLPNDRRVGNDVVVGPPGTVLLVTGSNMSGKSTLLRSIGVNVILAHMGSVVCARRLRLGPLQLATSMRIADSLSAGVSFFMAELQRLKVIVDRSRTCRDDGRLLLFLLDEVLQGTNSRERHLAVEAVVRQLLDHGAIGAITTHDLDLAGSSSLGPLAQAVYFTESFVERDGRKQMTFDYRLQRGVAPTTNALELLRLVGLKPPEST